MSVNKLSKFALGLSFSLLAFSGAMAQSKLSAGDQQILKDMATANMAEIELGRVAQQKSQSAEVKQFAQKMIDDHTTSLKDVQQVAQAKGVKLPDSVDAKHRAEADKLSKLSGEEFDAKYMAQGGVADHRMVHNKLAAADKKAKDADVKALVEKTQPVVAQHLEMAEQHHAGMKGATTTGTSGTAGTMKSGTTGSMNSGAMTDTTSPTGGGNTAGGTKVGGTGITSDDNSPAKMKRKNPGTNPNDAGGTAGYAGSTTPR